MTKSLPALALAIAGCSAIAAESEYQALPVPEQQFSVPQAVFEADLTHFPESREGRQELELDVTEQEDGSYVVQLTRTGFLDDSVNGDQQRAVLRYEGGGWRVAELGRRWRCQNGRGPAGWTTSLCH